MVTTLVPEEVRQWMALGVEDTVIFEYYLGYTDDLISLTLYHQLQLGKSKNSKECFEEIKKKSKFADSKSAEVQIDIIVQEKDLNQVKAEYKVDQDRINSEKVRYCRSRKSNRHTGYNKLVVALIPLEKLIKFAEVEQAINKLQNLDYLEVEVEDLNIDFFSSEGEGVSAKSVEFLIVGLEQQRHNLIKKTERLSNLQKEVENSQ